MFFGKQIMSPRIVRLVIFLSLAMAVMTAVSGCTAPKAGIVILENPNGKEFTVDFREWSASSKFSLSLEKGDILQIEVAREEGKIALTVSGKNGSEPYTGSKLETGLFTVTVSETDEYEVRITGENATGKVMVKNAGNIAKCPFPD